VGADTWPSAPDSAPSDDRALADPGTAADGPSTQALETPSGAGRPPRPTPDTWTHVTTSRRASGHDQTRPDVADAPTAEPREAGGDAPGAEASAAGAGERARAAAVAHHDDHGVLPTVSGLAALAQVSRSTAGAALQALGVDADAGRARPTLRVVAAPVRATASQASERSDP